MSFVTLAAIYFVAWWIVLFAVLPFGVHTEDDPSNMVAGAATSAPIRPMLVRKAIITSIITAILVGALWFVRVKLGIDLETLGRLGGWVN
jgi:predicted secreted protein